MYNVLSNKSPRQVIENLRGKIEGTLYFAILQALDIIWTEIKEIYRLFDDRPGGKKGGGQQATSTGIQARYLSVRIDYTAPELWPSNIEGSNTNVAALLWGNRRGRYYFHNKLGGSIESINGVIRFEGPDGLVYEHVVEFNLEFGSNALSPGKLIGFDVGFEQFNIDVKKFYIDVFEFDKTFQAFDSDLNVYTEINHIPTSSRKYRSTRQILTDAQLSKFINEGMRFQCDLTMLLKI